MSLYIIVSQSARLAAVWTRNRLTSKILISVSIAAYSLLLIERNKKINNYYNNGSNPHKQPEGSGGENR